MRKSSWSQVLYALSSYHLLVHVLMTPRRNPYGCVFCPIGPLALVEFDDDVGDAFGDARRAAHRARPPPAVVLVRALVGGGFADEERIDVGARRLLARVGDGALEQLGDDGRARFRGELEELQGFARVAAAHEVHDHAGLAGADAGKSGAGLADHSS